MQSRSTRIAYLKRMLKRLEAESLRLQNFPLNAEFSAQALEIAVQQLSRSRNDLLAQLQRLETNDPT
jgi:hypothetical protein